MATLYELKGSYQRLLDLEDDTDPTLFHDTLDSITDSIEVKAVGYAKVIGQLYSDIEQIKREEDRLKIRRIAIQTKAKIIKDNLTQALVETNQTKIKTPEYTIWVQKNPASLVIPDEGKLSPDYFHSVMVLDKEAVKKDLKAGKEILGASLEQSESVRIR